MSESNEELLARREALIEQLQGQWPLEVDTRSMNRKAIIAALITMLAAVVFTALMVFVMMAAQSSEQRAELGLSWVAPFMLVVGFISGTAVFLYIWGFGLWYRKLNPLEINGTRVVWAKRKGYVPEKMDLTRVNSVLRYDGAGSSRLMMGLINVMDRRSQTSFMQCVCISRGEHNAPRLIPAMFRDGHRLITTIEEIAAINERLEKMGEVEGRA